MAMSQGTKKAAGLAVAGLGIVANVIGVVGAFSDWGATTTIVAAAETQTETSTTTVPAATTTVATPAETAEEFLTALATAFVNADVEFQVARLHPEVVARYGEDQCRASFADNTPDPTAAFEIVTVLPPANYTWVTDNVSSEIPGTVSVDVVRTVEGEQTSLTVHITEVDGEFRFFSDCGDPI